MLERWRDSDISVVRAIARWLVPRWLSSSTLYAIVVRGGTVLGREVGVETVRTLHVVSLYYVLPTVVPVSAYALHRPKSSEGVAAWQHADSSTECYCLLDAEGRLVPSGHTVVVCSVCRLGLASTLLMLPQRTHHVLQAVQCT